MRGFTYLEDESWIENQMRRGTRGDLPISMRQAEQVTKWLKSNYGHELAAATKNTPFPPHVICGITCQETAYFWLRFLDQLEPAELLARCVLDASGDHSSSPRSAFPRNTAAFREEYDDEFADMLIGEANKTRALRDWSGRDWVYKGYGIFQYDLQYVVDDEAFFRERQWYRFDKCLDRLMKELIGKFARTGELWEAVRAYNGSGPRARKYKENVIKFCKVTEEVWEETEWPPEPKPVVIAAPQPPPTGIPQAETPAPAVASPEPSPSIPPPTPSAEVAAVTVAPAPAIPAQPVAVQPQAAQQPPPAQQPSAVGPAGALSQVADAAGASTLQPAQSRPAPTEPPATS